MFRIIQFMTNKLKQIKDNIKNEIDKLDKFIKKYKAFSKTIQIPSAAYMNWGIELAQKGMLNEALDKLETAALMPNQNPNVSVVRLKN